MDLDAAWDHGVGIVDKLGPQCICEKDFPFASGGWVAFNAHLREAAVRASVVDGAGLDVERLADAVHTKLCGPFATVDPQQCVNGRQRDVLAATAIAREYAALSATSTKEPGPDPSWMHSPQNDPAGLYDDQWEPRHDLLPEDTSEIRLVEDAVRDVWTRRSAKPLTERQKAQLRKDALAAVEGYRARRADTRKEVTP